MNLNLFLLAHTTFFYTHKCKASFKKKNKNKTITKSQTAAKINTFRLAFQTGSAYSTPGSPGVKKQQTVNGGNIFTL